MGSVPFLWREPSGVSVPSFSEAVVVVHRDKKIHTVGWIVTLYIHTHISSIHPQKELSLPIATL